MQRRALAIAWALAGSIAPPRALAADPAPAAAAVQPGAAGTPPAAADVQPGAADVPPGRMTFRVFAGAAGLRNLAIHRMAQDGHGLLWLATDDGVYRFDGEHFTRFSTADGLPEGRGAVVGIAPGGEPCVGSTGGLACWDGARFAPDRALPAGATVHAIASFAGRLWLGTSGAGLLVRGAGGALVPPAGWTGGDQVRALWADAGGLVVGDGATVWLTAGDGAWRTAGALGDALGDAERVDGVLRDRDGALWIRTASHLWFLPRGATATRDLRDGLPASVTVAGVPTGMALGPRGEVLVGTDAGFAYRDGERWRLIDRSAGLPAAPTRTLFVDREQTLWLASAGLSQLRGRGLVEHHSAASGLPGDDVWSAGRDPQGTLWLGTNRCLARAAQGRWACLPGTEGRTVRSLAFPPQGGVFAGGSPPELLYIDPAGRATALGPAQRDHARTILALALGPDGALWIGTESGLDRLPGAAGAAPAAGAIEPMAIPGMPAGGRVASLLAAADQLWVASDHGLAVLDGGAWHRFDRAHGFPSSAMRYLVRRADGRLCASHSEAIGVTCFRYAAGAVSELARITVEDGLASGMVYFLGEDHRGRLWIGTGAGVDVVTPDGVDHFDHGDGLAGDDSTATGFLADRDGSLWLGAIGGVSHLRAQHYDGPLAPPRAVIVGARLGDGAILGATGGPGATPRATEVPHDRNALTVELASSLLDPGRIEYQVRLAPEDSRWTTTRQRQHRYPALPPGDHRFEVRARRGGGAWGPAAALRFTVLPAWWQTGWFYLGVAAIAIGLLATGVHLRQRAVLRRRTRQLYEQSDAGVRAVIDLMPDLISVHRAGKLIYLNAASRRFLGMERGDERWEEVSLVDVVHPDDRGQVRELFRRVRNLGLHTVSEVVELQMRAADGTWRHCEVSAIRVEMGGVLTVVASGRDVTERKRMGAKLVLADRMASLGTLAAGIAHEINNPLTYVAGNLEALAEALQAAQASGAAPDGKELVQVVGDARDGADRVRRIVQGLRAFSRSQEQEQRVTLVIGDVLEAAIRLTSNEVRHRAELVCELGAVPPVVADDGRLTQVFINLLVNAAHAIPEGHSRANRITVRSRTDAQGRAVVEVEDTGQGMAPEVMARAFDPFFTTKRIGEGTGLGLAICHSIVSGLGGQITLDSAPGRGTVVRVVLPAQAQAGAPAPAAPAAAQVAASEPGPQPAPRRPRVMLVDDEPQVAHTMERLLRRDYDITVALNGQEALAHITGGARFDAIVSDVMMPNMTGIELSEELQRLAPDQAGRLIFLSGGAFTAQTRERLAELGAPQLEKPVTAKELRACVLRVASAGKP